MKNFYFLGDSICYGQWFPVHKNWVSMFSEKIESDGYTVMNCSVIGNTSSQGMSRMYHEVLFRDPSYVYVQFGMNDCNFWDDQKGLPRVSLELFSENMSEIKKRVESFGAIPVFGTNHRSQKNKLYDQNNIDYNKSLRSLCADLDVDLVDHELLIGEKRVVMKDGIHLNELGHNMYLNNMMKWAQSSLA